MVFIAILQMDLYPKVAPFADKFIQVIFLASSCK